MADVVLPERPALAVIPNVELLHVGEEWPLASDGTQNGTFTPEDLAAAVAAQDDPSVRSPVIKFGHNGNRPPAFGAPVWGRVTNLRLADEGMTLVGDYTGVPVWLAEILPSAWPSRSVEGKRGHTSDVGRTHDLIITAVSLLGVELPAISTLDDVQAVWSARTPEEANVTLKEATVTAARTVAVAASTTTEDIRRAYYDKPVAGVWSWIREIELDPLTLIVDDEEGGLFRVPVTITGDEITFGTPEAVRVEYVAAAAAATSASRAEAEVIVYASRAESRQGVAGMDVAELRKALKLGDDVSDEDVVAQAAARLVATPEPTPTPDPTGTGDQPKPEATDTPAPFTPPPGTKLVDEATWADVTQKAEQGALAASRMREQERSRFIAQVRGEGRLAASNAKLRETLEREWDRDPVNARAIADTLARVVPTAEVGLDEGGEESSGDSTWDDFERNLSPDVAATRSTRDQRRS